MLILNKQLLPSCHRLYHSFSGEHTLTSDQSRGSQEYCMFAEHYTLGRTTDFVIQSSGKLAGGTCSTLPEIQHLPHEMSTHPPARPSGCLVILNGFPGVGKLTIARSLQSRLTNVETRLIDNHLIIDPAEAIHPGRGRQHKAFRNKLRQTIFDEVKTIPERDTVLIMTSSLGANLEDTAVFAEYLEVSWPFVAEIALQS
jgi:hypothetical protein